MGPMIPATLYDPADLPGLEAEVLLDHAAIADLPEGERWRAERVALWPVIDLEFVFHRRHGKLPDPAEYPTRGSLVREVAKVVVGVSSAMTARRTSFEVARFVGKRWGEAGTRRWGRDARGLPVPLAAGSSCDMRFAFRLSPSGKALFSCASCASAPSPVPSMPAGHVCPGRLNGSATYIVEALLAGVRYEVRDFGGLALPLPVGGDGLLACRRCWEVGEWDLLDRVGRLPVCPACHLLDPAPWPSS